MLSKETRDFHQARHDQLVELVRKNRTEVPNG